MTNIIIFPGMKNLKANDAKAAVRMPAKSFQQNKPTGGSLMSKFISGIIKGVWLVTVLLWPVLKWIVSIEVFFRLVVMLYHWNTPGTHTGWIFILHFGVLTALTYFVSIYKPKGL